MDLAKRDLMISMNGRTFSVRAYHDGTDSNGPQWHTVIIENRTPVTYERAPESSAAASLAEAVRYLVTFVDLSNGGASEGRVTTA
jgi:hypothetical protein